MQLELAIVQSSTDTGCHVRLLDNNEVIHTDFSASVIRDRSVIGKMQRRDTSTPAECQD